MNVRSTLIIIFAAILFGCTSTEEKKEVAVEEGAPAGEKTQAYGAGEDTGTGINPLDDPNSPLSVRIIYFEYDSSEIRPQYRKTVEAHAAYLASNPNVIVTLEGHADERGSREYNLALGERRSLSVKNQMALLGASAGQIRTVSYGEERPAAAGSDESAWSQNRRVEILY
ncbi:MAG: peptidoglycan-associated lipoprotein Pal [Gammaproteobacteria bacterium]|nr:peptidoglycan-associated lipoprotein Pal [Gammaproteobacteria bacterium]